MTGAHLKFINDDVRVLCLDLGAQRGRGLQNLDRGRHKVVHVHRVAMPQRSAVVPAHELRLRTGEP